MRDYAISRMGRYRFEEYYRYFRKRAENFAAKHSYMIREISRAEATNKQSVQLRKGNDNEIVAILVLASSHTRYSITYLQHIVKVAMSENRR